MASKILTRLSGKIKSLKQHTSSHYKYSNSTNTQCEVGVKGKLARLPFKESLTNSTSLLELIHTDLSGPMPVSSIKFSRYILTFVDDFSKTVTVYCIENKSILNISLVQSTSRDSNWEKDLNSAQRQCYKILQSCNGRFLRVTGIKHQTTVPYSPQQNGRVI